MSPPQQLSAVSAIILAGGRSRRLGRDKAWLEIGGQTIIERVLARLRPLFEEVMIVAPSSPPFQSLGVRVVPDELPGKGPLGGLYSGLRASTKQWVFCCACDMPFLNKNLIAALTAQANQADAVICRWEGRLQPLHGLYARTCLPTIRKNLENEQKRMIDILPALKVKYPGGDFIAGYDPKGYSFFNLNTPQALNRAEKIAESIK